MSNLTRIRIAQVLILILVLAVWEYTGRTAPRLWTSSPSLVLDAFLVSLAKGEIVWHVWVTLSEALSGLAVGAVVGVVLGLILGASRIIGPAVEPFIIALNSLPRVALAPLIIMFVGIGFASKFLLAFSLVVVPMMINTWEGIRATDPVLLNVMRVMRASRLQTFFKVLLPNSVPWIFSGLRVSLTFAIIGAIVGELISARAGIGYMIDTAAGGFDATGMLMPLIVLMLVSFTLDRLLLLLSGRFLRWRSPAA